MKRCHALATRVDRIRLRVVLELGCDERHRRRSGAQHAVKLVRGLADAGEVTAIEVIGGAGELLWNCSC